MGRIFEPIKERPRRSDSAAMGLLQVHKVTEYYKQTKEGYAINDGKFITFIQDYYLLKEDANESNKDNN